MRNFNNRAIDDIVFNCCRELFSAYKLDVQPRSRSEFPATEALAACGVMGFGGKSMRGALVLATTREPLQHTNPHAFGSERDWVCELANQLMGRVKNQLLTLGVEILLATPAGLRGENLCPTLNKVRAPQVFAASSGFVCVWIDCEYTDGFELPSSPPPGLEPPVAEGDALLF